MRYKCEAKKNKGAFGALNDEIKRKEAYDNYFLELSYKKQ